MKPLFNIEESRKQCPPELLYTKGVTFKKRVILKRGKNGVVTYPEQLNPRVLHVITEKVPELRDSFLVNGFDTSRPPPTIKVDPNDKNRYVGLSGWHRDAAADMLGWETMIYDVLEFDSPLTERKHRHETNKVKYPQIPYTIDDVVKQLKEAVACNEIKNNDYDIKLLISELCDDKTPSVRAKIFKKFRSHVSSSSTIRNYHTQGGPNSSEEFALKYNLPYEGDKNYENTKKLGYLTGVKTPKTTLYDAKNLSIEYKGADVEIYSWIMHNPKEAPAIYTQREKWKQSYDSFIKKDCQFIQHIAKKCGFNISLDMLIGNHPLKFKGFMAQDITPNPLDGGKPKEQGLVDINGNILKND
jgi:hypothetical protein